MARIRSVKPEFFTSLTVANLSLSARLTFIGLWTHADDEGLCVADARLIRAAIWPLDDRSTDDIVRDLQELTESSVITHYEVSGRCYIAVDGWREHQRINRPTKSKLPPPSEGRTVPLTSANSSNVRPHGALTEDSREEGKGTGKGTGKGREQGTQQPSVAAVAGAPAPDLSDLTVTQRSKRITDAYHEAEPMCRWPAINGMVIKAIQAEKWTDGEIQDALLRMAKEGRPVTVDSLRIELNGLPPSRFARPAPAAAPPMVDNGHLPVSAENWGLPHLAGDDE